MALLRLVAAAVCALAFAGTASADWSEPAAIGKLGREAGAADLFMNADGRALLFVEGGETWQRPPSAAFAGPTPAELIGRADAQANVFVIARGDDYAWGSLADPFQQRGVADTGDGTDQGVSHVRVGPAGHAALVVNRGQYIDCVRLYPPGGAWSECHETGLSLDGEADPALNSAGDLLLREDATTCHPGGELLFRPAGGPFGAPIRVSSTRHVTFDALALDDDGNALAVGHGEVPSSACPGEGGSARGLDVIRRSADGTLSSSVVEGARPLAMGQASGGRLVLVWVERTGGDNVSGQTTIKAIRGTVAGGFAGQPVVLASRTGFDPAEGNAVLGENGDALVSFIYLDFTAGSARSAAFHLPATGGSDRVPFHACAGARSGGPEVAIAANGEALVAYECVRPPGGDDKFDCLTGVHVVGLNLRGPALGPRVDPTCGEPPAPSPLSLAVSPRRFRAAARPQSGARLAYRFDREGRARFDFHRKHRGRRAPDGRCVRPTGANRHRRRCTRLVLAATVRWEVSDGGYRRPFGGWLFIGRRWRALAPGAYRVSAQGLPPQGSNAGPSRPRRAHFTVLPRFESGGRTGR